MEHREIKTPEQIAELKLRSTGGYRNLRETVINELPESELLRTPSVVDSTGGAISESQARERGRMLKVSDQVVELAFDNGLQVSESIAASLLPTPVTTDGKPVDVANQVLTRNSLTLQSITAILDMPEDTWEKTDLSRNKARQVGESAKRREEADSLMPTPAAKDYRDGTKPHERDGVVQIDTVARAVFNSGEITLFPTLRASDSYERRNQKTMDRIAAEGGDMTMPTLARTTTNWGKFAPAIARWERLTRPAPSPTKPDGKDGNHRLSAEFTEWMMGLPAGWVTAEDLGLKRNDQLKACGNGVVPQQAELALKILLQDVTI